MMNTRVDPSFWEVWLGHQDVLSEQSHRWMKGHGANAEDALSVTLLRSARAWPLLSGRLVHERAWLQRILRNVCMDAHREQQRRAALELETALRGDEEDDAWPRTGRSPEEVLLLRERMEQLRGRIQGLPVQLSAPFTLRVFRAMSYDDIARQLNLTNSNVRKRVQLARRHLRPQARGPSLSRTG